MTINQVQCDGCGQTAETTREYGHYWKPDHWDSFRKKDLCPDCTKKVEEFIQSLKK